MDETMSSVPMPQTRSVLTDPNELRLLLDNYRRSGGTVGFVGTSGGLHDGHLSLIRASQDDGNLTILWLFTGRIPIASGVLPSYARDYDRDQELAFEAGASIVFRPPNESLFALGPPLVRLQVAESLMRPWPGSGEGVFVDMVATIMTKAISLIGPCRLYCGEKDWQNVATLKRAVVDLSLAAEIVPCPSVREPDGVVLGSRNVKLTPEERRSAPRIKSALDAAATLIIDGETDPDRVEASLRAELQGMGRLEYAVVVDATDLIAVRPLHGDLRILTSVAFSNTNLMDNVGVSVPLKS